jgi:hypothetical protein
MVLPRFLVALACKAESKRNPTGTPILEKVRFSVWAGQIRAECSPFMGCRFSTSLLALANVLMRDIQI